MKEYIVVGALMTLTTFVLGGDWRWIQVVADTEGKGTKLKGIAIRIGYNPRLAQIPITCVEMKSAE